MQGLEGQPRGSGRPSPGILRSSAPHDFIQSSRVHFAILLNRCQNHFLKIAQAPPSPRMNDLPELLRSDSVGKKEKLLERKLGIQALEFSSSIILHPMSQNQILRPRRTSNGIGLNKAHSFQGTGQVGFGKKATANHVFPKLTQCSAHNSREEYFQRLPEKRKSYPLRLSASWIQMPS